MSYNDHDNYWSLYDKWSRSSEGRNETSVLANRWSSLTILSALLERRVWIKQGMFNIYPNMYVQLLGEPSSKKSTAIKTAKKLLKMTGYDNFSSEKTTMEAFLQGLHDMTFEGFDVNGYLKAEGSAHDILDIDTVLDNIGNFDNKKKLTGASKHKMLKKLAETLIPVHCMIAADEFMDFIGRGNIEFISLLGTLWDWDDGVYDKQITSRASTYANNPLINILSGNTPDNFALTFPPEIQGQGFFARILLIHVVSTGRQIPKMYEPTQEDTDALLEFIADIYNTCQGELEISDELWHVIGEIYTTWKPIQDVRFARYSGRRQTHFLKLVMLMTVSRCSMEVILDDIIMANTILSYAESIMPLAMGEFGRGKSSNLINTIMKLVANGGDAGLSIHQILAQTITEADNLNSIQEAIGKLQQSNKIQVIDHKYYPCRTAIQRVDSKWVRPSWLSDEEVNTVF